MTPALPGDFDEKMKNVTKGEVDCLSNTLSHFLSITHWRMITIEHTLGKITLFLKWRLKVTPALPGDSYQKIMVT